MANNVLIDSSRSCTSPSFRKARGAILYPRFEEYIDCNLCGVAQGVHVAMPLQEFSVARSGVIIITLELQHLVIEAHKITRAISAE